MNKSRELEFAKGETMTKRIVGVAELRSLVAEHRPAFKSAPDWVIINLYERHYGLPISNPEGKPPMRSLAELNRKYEKRVIAAPTKTAPVITDEEREQMQRRLALASL
jgi:hypothetical protein